MKLICSLFAIQNLGEKGVIFGSKMGVILGVSTLLDTLGINAG